MIITNAKYIDNEEAEPDTITATINGVTYGIPMDTGNRHYAEILKQVADGDITIAEAD